MTSGVGRQSKLERRRTLALKWYHLDHLQIDEIQERLLEEGYESGHGEGPRFSRRTIRKWIQSDESQEVLERIKDKHTEVRVQVAERHEDLYQRARTAEMEATADEDLWGLEPVEEQADGRLKDPKRIDYSWEVVSPGEDLPSSAPLGADPRRDTIIRIVPGQERVEPGESYPKRDWKGEPVYTKTQIGLQRDVPDRRQRSFLRQEQSEHLEAKGEALGIYSQELTVSGELNINADVTVPETVIQAVITASKSNLRGEDVEIAGQSVDVDEDGNGRPTEIAASPDQSPEQEGD